MSSVERTLAIIKPDATKRNLTGAIMARMEEAGLHIIAQRRIVLSLEQAQNFYSVHAERAFFGALCQFMSSGPVVVIALEGMDAVSTYRELMGSTNPAMAAKGTIRADFAESIEANSVHGSDSLENAEKEIAFFFAQIELCA
jgi:nucleoside-diphosphate kinase